MIDNPFEPQPGDCNIEIDHSVQRFYFSRRWFRRRNQVTYSSKLLPKFNGTSPVRMIQIGVFEAMDLVWQLQNTLKHPDSRAVAIDPYIGSNYYNQGMEDVYKNAKHNLKPYEDKVTLLRGPSQEILPMCVREGEIAGFPVGSFDYVIIDGEHSADVVIQDAVASLEMVKVGGWMVFDDARPRPGTRPRRGDPQFAISKFAKDNRRVRHVWSHHYCDCYERTA